MVLIAVAGGTGHAGRAVAADAAGRGLKVRSVSRHVPETAGPGRVAGVEHVAADFRTGDGVAEALAGVDLLVETLDARTGPSLKALPATTVAVLAAAQRAQVSRCVLLTIVNAAQSSMGYYQVQAARARSYEASGMPTTVVYATQFHDLVAGIFSAGSRVGIIPTFSGVSFQSIATADVARVLVDEAVAGLGTGAEVHRSIKAGGPSVWPMKSMGEQWKSATGRRGVVASMPLPGSFGTFLRAGKNLVPDAAVGRLEFNDWLAAGPRG
ncbi:MULTISPECIES: SDR family oxidoreductase [unclassified Arthrobacter]|uniref:SDR family oxidoreductase n=1 Tax=unclassified Arthrobacter TaxID=235627 RepID=UPI00159DD90F|nr:MULTISPECIES: NAD(P)H-binding protein [unclassified Arthrobacter]MCQ9165976.1 NAD(P)H-binding protein [Arthrobacter sp. STN4]NVM98547.1 NAD(P)H-binding protein [Arthrobacter sp. SDTb3-6]